MVVHLQHERVTGLEEDARVFRIHDRILTGDPTGDEAGLPEKPGTTVVAMFVPLGRGQTHGSVTTPSGLAVATRDLLGRRDLRCVDMEDLDVVDLRRDGRASPGSR